jgi:5'-nucleotidase
MSVAARSGRRSLAALLALALVGLLLAALAARPAEAAGDGRATFRLTLLQTNDGESQLLGAPEQPDFGGVARVATLVDQLRAEGSTRAPGQRFFPRPGVVLVSAGDNFLAGPEFNASLERGIPFYDAVAMDEIGYDAIALGNHEFDFGPDVTADFIASFPNIVPILAANLDVSGEPRLAALAAQGRLTTSALVTERGRRIGVIGLVPPELRSLSSPRNAEASGALAEVVQSEVDALTAQGANIILIASQLGDIRREQELVTQVTGVDIVVAGGGQELLANPGDLLVPGDEEEVFGPYPLEAVDAEGRTVPVVTTNGNYAYVGRLVADFDIQGNLVDVDEEASGPVRVSGVGPDAVAPDPAVTEQVVEPVTASIAALEETVIGETEVGLDGRRTEVRSTETNLGNLVADALLTRAAALAPEFGAPVPDVSLQNGGGMRNDAIIPPGPLTELDTFDVLPFANFVSVVPAVPRDQFKQILENAVSQVETGAGRFAQVGGFSFTYDPAGTAQVVDDAGNVLTPGTRVVDVTLADGTPIVTAGAVVPGEGLDVATIDFLARGGDQYPFRGLPFTNVGISYQQALRDYIELDLAGLVSAADYPEGGEGRITP